MSSIFMHKYTKINKITVFLCIKTKRIYWHIQRNAYEAKNSPCNISVLVILLLKHS